MNLTNLLTYSSGTSTRLTTVNEAFRSYPTAAAVDRWKITLYTYSTYVMDRALKNEPSATKKQIHLCVPRCVVPYVPRTLETEIYSSCRLSFLVPAPRKAL